MGGHLPHPFAGGRVVSIAEAAQAGRRDLLVALRDHIAARIDAGVSARDLVGLSRRLIDIAAEVRALDDNENPGGLRVVDGPFDPKAV